jgi:adenosylhomocysteine nucleosidase
MSEHEQAEPDSAHADIGIVAALPMELAPFLDRCDRVRKYTGGNFTFRGGRLGDIRVAVVEGGVGFARARRATTALIEAHSPPWIIAAGFCGGLRPDVHIGDIVVADAVLDTHGQELRVDIKLGEAPRDGLHLGRLVTSDGIVRTIQEKQTLADRFGAVAVDMESLAVAQVCRETQTKFLAVRAVSDDLSADLPPEVLSLVGATGSMRFGAAMGALIKRPGSLKVMWQLREDAHKAAARLAVFLDGVVCQLHAAAS